MESRTQSWWAYAVGLFAILGSTVLALFALGRRVWGENGIPGFWSGDVNSSHNSQFVADAYTFTHVVHGIAFAALFAYVARRLSLRARFLLTIFIEAAWEIIENTNAVVEHYRAATISLHYYGDSIVNSMADITACAIGFIIASWLPRWATIVVVIAIEVTLVVLIRDSLLLNIIMLIYPIPAIKAWQSQA